MESANESTQPRRGARFNPTAAALLFGIILGSGLGAAAVYSELRETRMNLMSTTNAMESYRRELDRAKAQISERNNEQTSAVTILYEPKPPLDMRTFEGWINVNGSRIAMPQNGTGAVPRWYIPAKVMPTAYGSDGRMQVLYFNAATRQFDGPYLPRQGSQ